MLRPVVHIKYLADAWRVYEHLPFTFSGAGEHVYFYVEKRQLNSLDVARELARNCGVDLHQVGYAGLKDKHAVTRQWFSVPYAKDHWPLACANIHCLQIARHSHKLRRGQHSANEFILRLRFEEDAARQHLAALDDWFPNYFGPQRVSATNVAAARAWLLQGAGQSSERRERGNRRSKRRGAGGRQGWHLSVLRSDLFNAVLDARVEQGTFNQVIAGDVVDHGVPTGPLWGRGRSPAADQAQSIEQQALQTHKEICDALEFTGLQQGRRRLAQKPEEFRMTTLEAADQEVEVSFFLPPGAYATTLLAHKLTVRDDSNKYE